VTGSDVGPLQGLESLVFHLNKKMSTKSKRSIIALTGFSLSAAFSTRPAAAQLIPPGVPEPGLVIWGTVVNQTNNQPITITSVQWTVTDGSNTAAYSAASLPATRIINVSGQSYYVLQVPFDTRQIGTVTLADPVTVGINSFMLRSSSPPTYMLMPKINGTVGNVRSIDGAPASGTNAPVAGFTAATRGRAIRVDLAITPGALDYASWVAIHFGSASHPDAAPTADPDGDGLNNRGEFEAGTDPNEASSVLRILRLTVHSPTQAVLDWQSISSKSYVIQTAAEAQGPWSDLVTVGASGGTNTQHTLNLSAQELRRFYRIRPAQ
jgi:hypothetical protein